MTPLRITACSIACSAGTGVAALASSLRGRRGGLRPNDFTEVPLETWIGRVPGLEDLSLPSRLANWDCRNNRLAWLGLQCDGFLERASAARERYGRDRIAIVLGTSTSSIGATEEAYRRLLPDGQYPEDLRRPIVHTPHSLGAFVREALGLEGVVVTVGATLSWTLFDGLARFADRRERQAQAKLADLDVQAAARRVDVEVREALVSLENQRASLKQASVAYDVAKKNAAETAELYRQGLASALEVADANVSLFEAEVALVQERYGLGVAFLNLEAALGLDPFGKEPRT